MPKLVWYRSLYWRIALGFVALLATLLVLQGFAFLWMTGRMTDLFPSRSPAQFAALMAADVSTTLAEHPETDLETYLNGKYSRSSRGFVVALDDGRMILSQRVPPPPMLSRAARGRLFEDRYPDRRGRSRGPDQGRGYGPGPGAGSGPNVPPGRDFYGAFAGGNTPEFAQIAIDGAPVGVVAVPREAPPLSVAMRDLGPTLALVAFGLLAGGTAIGALVIFRPARRRLKDLQEATQAVGAGVIGTRAAETGGDEVTSLARAFNRMATQLEHRTLALENADRTRRQLLADVSHELTTPLAAIRGYVETLGMSDVPLDTATRGRYLDIVLDETVRLEHIIGDLLDLARLEGGGGSIKMEEVSVEQLLERVRHRHEPIVRDRQIHLDTIRDSRVTTVIGDQNRLEQAMQNLVANAVRHTPSGGTVTVTAEPREDQIVFRVEDTGPGIPAEHLSRVFDRFYKVDESRSATAAPSGSGLGLSIVQAIVARHGGTIRASNGASGGARFEIALPGEPLGSGSSVPPRTHDPASH